MLDATALFRTLAGVPGTLYRRAKRRAGGRYYAWYFDQRPDHPALSGRVAAEAVQGADRILFLCLGNICRSPLAERYLRTRLDEAEVDGVTVDSAGLGIYEDIASPDTAVEAAAALGIDLADHRSTRITDRQVAESDVVFVMDYVNYFLLADQHPDALDRTFFLRAFVDDGAAAIPDPHGADRERFDAVYGTVVEALDEVAAALDRPTQVQ